MLNKLLIPASVILVLLAWLPPAQGHVIRANPDAYMYIPPDYCISCEEARALLRKDGYRILGTIRCGGNYHKFRAQRRDVDYVVQVMTSRGKRMIDARSR